MKESVEQGDESHSYELLVFVQKMKLLFWCGKEYKKVGDAKCQSL